MKILELFSGYGTASFALKSLGMDYKLVGYSDIDKYANQCFKQNHCTDDVNDKLRLGDVKLINPNDLEDFDLLTGGFPCQSFSVAGKGLGELDARGTLFYEIIRIAEVKKPRYMLLENVKGLTNKNHRQTFEKILSELSRIGYKVHWKILNTKNYGVPQNRERVWFACFREQEDYDKFKFPPKEELTIFIKDILEQEVDKYFLSEDAVKRLEKRCNIGKDGIMGCLTSTIYKVNWNTPLIKTRNSYVQYDFGNRSQQDRIYNIDCISPTITQNIPKILWEEKIRRLTPKECFRLQGFLNDEVDISNLSDTQCYKLAGNGQSLNVVTKIFKEMFK
jgi:DNA (cytosine-5)-methyltransferase 1